MIIKRPPRYPIDITPLTVTVDNSMWLEHSQGFLVLPVKEAGIIIIDDMLKSCSRPAQNYHLGHQLAVVPVFNMGCKDLKINRDVVSL